MQRRGALDKNRAQSLRGGRFRYGQRTLSDSLTQRPPSPPVGPLFQRVVRYELLAALQPQNRYGEKAEISDCAYVASYNWSDRDEPTLLIPGMPPAWTPLDRPCQLQEDSGNYFRDPNGARFPDHRLEPAVRALLMEKHGFNTQEIDLFACASTIGSLLRFARGVEKPFRFFVETIGNTVFFDRHENSPTELIQGVKGYGHTFPEAYTTWDADVKGSASHQRLLKYKFAGLDCILRFECDGYLKSRVHGVAAESVKSQTPREDEEFDEITSALNSTKVTSSLEKGKKHGSVLNIIMAGQKIPQDAVFDLKTRSKRKVGINVLEDELPRYWVAQIPNFIIARHDSGIFDDIQVQYIWDDVKKWEQENQENIKKLCWLLRKIIKTVKVRGDGKLEVCCKSLEVLELREQGTVEHNVLPLEIKCQWIDDGWSEEIEFQREKESGGGVLLPVSIESRQGSNCDDDLEKDYTACSADGCGYCGHCSY